MEHYVSEYGYITLNSGERVEVEHLRVVGTFADRSDAENAARFFQDSQGGCGFDYVAESVPGTAKKGITA